MKRSASLFLKTPLGSEDDYDGGEFYVATKRNDTTKLKPPSIIRMCSPQLDAGDMVIFQASKGAEYDHGMKTVTRGERVAIGLLQPK